MRAQVNLATLEAADADAEAEADAEADARETEVEFSQSSFRLPLLSAQDGEGEVEMGVGVGVGRSVEVVVEVYGRVAYRRYLALAAGSSLFLEPAHYGGCNTLVDALAAGVPTLTVQGGRWFNRVGTHTLQWAQSAQTTDDAGARVAEATEAEEYSRVVAACPLSQLQAAHLSDFSDKLARLLADPTLLRHCQHRFRHPRTQQQWRHMLHKGYTPTAPAAAAAAGATTVAAAAVAPSIEEYYRFAFEWLDRHHERLQRIKQRELAQYRQQRAAWEKKYKAAVAAVGSSAAAAVDARQLADVPPLHELDHPRQVVLIRHEYDKEQAARGQAKAKAKGEGKVPSPRLHADKEDL